MDFDAVRKLYYTTQVCCSDAGVCGVFHYFNASGHYLYTEYRLPAMDYIYGTPPDNLDCDCGYCVPDGGYSDSIMDCTIDGGDSLTGAYDYVYDGGAS